MVGKVHLHAINQETFRIHKSYIIVGARRRGIIYEKKKKETLEHSGNVSQVVEIMNLGRSGEKKVRHGLQMERITMETGNIIIISGAEQ